MNLLVKNKAFTFVFINCIPTATKEYFINDLMFTNTKLMLNSV